jgi:hypothetical protein
VARTGYRRDAYRVQMGSTEGNRSLEDVGVDEKKIVLEWISKSE